MKSLPIVSIIGRPNVGKSTLFNRLVGKRVAIVDSTPGVTRDRLFADIEWNKKSFSLVDTAGILVRVMARFEGEILAQVEAAIEQADVLLFVVDGKEGPAAEDEEVARKLRRTGKPVILAVNKVDSTGGVPSAEFHRWGFQHFIGISALTGTGTGDLLDFVNACLPERPARELELPENTIRVAVIGKPNVGKSSLVNRLVGQERMLVSETSGTTRDPVDTMIRYHGRPVVLVDTAGLRKRMKSASGLDYYTLIRTVHSIQRCDIAVLLIDSREGPSRQDLRIVNMAVESGKSLILAMNKWDLVGGKKTNTASGLEKEFKKESPHLAHLPVIFISALTGQRVSRLLDLLVEIGDGRRETLPTSRINEVIRAAVDSNQPPACQGKHVRLLYCTQVQTGPPTFVIFSNYPDNIPEHYRRYLVRKIREAFPFPGTPIRLLFRKRESGRPTD